MTYSPFLQLVDTRLSTSWFFIISGIVLKSSKAPKPTGQGALVIFIKILSSFSQAYCIIVLNQNLLPE